MGKTEKKIKMDWNLGLCKLFSLTVFFLSLSSSVVCNSNYECSSTSFITRLCVVFRSNF